MKVNGGLEVFRGGTEKNAQMIWDETSDSWKAGLDGSLKEIAYSDHLHLNLYSGGGIAAVSVDQNGNVGIGTVPTAEYELAVDGEVRAVKLVETSSRSYKENIAKLPVRTALDLLNKLNPVSFDFKADTSKKHNIGFIAEEVPEVFSTSDRKSVALMDIIGVLTTVVKKQQKETTTLQKQVTALQKQIASLMGA